MDFATVSSNSIGFVPGSDPLAGDAGSIFFGSINNLSLTNSSIKSDSGFSQAGEISVFDVAQVNLRDSEISSRV
ncbi:MAG: hypothetical protein GWN24_09775, partial [Nitrospinaceae bacterium]|nr:hypothetical protein [Nitrospinaceae bacterium]